MPRAFSDDLRSRILAASRDSLSARSAACRLPSRADAVVHASMLVRTSSSA